MVHKINPLMAVQKDKLFFILFFMFILIGDAYTQNNRCVELSKNICHKRIMKGDTIAFAVVNKLQINLEYHLEVMMYVEKWKKWEYSPYYTRYYNYKLTYSKLQQMFSSKLPVTFSQNYTEQSRILAPAENSKLSFVAKSNYDKNVLIKFRITGVNECKAVYTNPFYFVRIEGDEG
jgi:hypothetical protein